MKGPAVLILAAAVLPGLHSAAASECITASREWLTAGELAAHLPAFASLDPATPVLTTPGPGVERYLIEEDWSRIRRKLGLEFASPQNVCLRLQAEPLTREAVEAALQQAAASLAKPGSDVSIDLLEHDRAAFPPGHLKFSASGPAPLPGQSDADVYIWRGSVTYGINRSVPVWARVRYFRRERCVVPFNEVDAGVTLSEAMLQTVTLKLAPRGAKCFASVPAVAGAMTRRALPAGVPIYTRDIALPVAVQRGDTVDAIAKSGQVSIRLKAKALTSAHRGESILIERAEGRARLKAQVTDDGEVVILGGMSRAQ